jgi:hypothetical protein
MTETQTKAAGPRTLQNIRTAVTARVRSKPTTEAQCYLDLWTLKRDHARWSQTKERAEQMLQTIDKALKKIVLPEAAVSGSEPDGPRATRTLDFKTTAGRNLRT